MRKELKKKIIDSGMSQVQLATELGIHATRLSEFVNGWKAPDGDLKKKIAGLLNCRVSEIF